MSKAKIQSMLPANPLKKAPAEPAPKVVSKGRDLLAPMQPYLNVVANDIKTLLRVDDKRKRDKMVYRDFMEQHFGKVPKKK